MASISGSASSSSYEPYARGMPNCVAAARAFSRVREAMAVISQYVPCCMAGITLVVAILAVLRMPQRTLFMLYFLFERTTNEHYCTTCTSSAKRSFCKISSSAIHYIHQTTTEYIEMEITYGVSRIGPHWLEHFS